MNTDIADPRLDARIESILHGMTLEEKIGQLVQYSAGQPTGPGTGRSDYKDMIAHGEISALLNVTDTAQINEYQHIAMEKSRLHIPLLFGLDVIHGFRTEFPIPLAIASTWDPELTEKAAHVAATEASAIGIRWTFSPMVDISRDARWGRIAESGGEDPYLGSAIAAAYVRGYQGLRLDAPDSVAACAKHYVGYGAAEGGRDYNSTEISEHTLREFYLPPFRAAVNAGTATLMSAFNSLNGVPSSANPFTLAILRNEWGFKGIVDSDWSSIGELVAHGIAVDGATAARKALLAGVDMDMVSSLYHDHLAQLVHSGAVPETKIDESVRRVLRVKLALGLFEHPYADEARARQPAYQPENLDLARTVAEHSFVLLKNTPASNGKPLLPISSEAKTVAVIGPLADDPTGPDSWASSSPKSGVLSFPAELARHLGEKNVMRAKGVEILTGDDQGVASAVETAKRADLVILTLGESAEMSGEAASRAFLGLPGRQQELLEAIVNTGKPVVLVLFSGRPLTIPWAFEHVPAVLEAWFPGTETGPALARTLFGEANPSGKLVVSWPRSVGQEPLYYNALSTGRPAGAIDLTRPPSDVPSRYVSRYIDEQNIPQFSFGYGGSYTTFKYGPTEITKTQLGARALNEAMRSTTAATAAVTVEATVSNTGSRAGEEVVQLYVRLQGTNTAQPVRSLKGFQHIVLAPAETKKVTFNLTPDAFAIWNDHNEFAVEPAKVTVWIAPDSASGSEAKMEIQP